jgi:hypothetical protein
VTLGGCNGHKVVEPLDETAFIESVARCNRLAKNWGGGGGGGGGGVSVATAGAASSWVSQVERICTSFLSLSSSSSSSSTTTNISSSVVADFAEQLSRILAGGFTINVPALVVSSSMRRMTATMFLPAPPSSSTKSGGRHQKQYHHQQQSAPRSFPVSLPFVVPVAGSVHGVLRHQLPSICVRVEVPGLQGGGSSWLIPVPPSSWTPSRRGYLSYDIETPVTLQPGQVLGGTAGRHHHPGGGAGTRNAAQDGSQPRFFGGPWSDACKVTLTLVRVHMQLGSMDCGAVSSHVSLSPPVELQLQPVRGNS